MNKVLAVATLALLCGLPVIPSSHGADAKTELETLVGKIGEKLQSGKTSAADLADDFKSFDSLLAEHKDEKTEDVANILFMKAALYAEVLNDDVTASTELQQLKTDFPGTESAKKADALLADLAKQHEANEIQRRLSVGAAFPAFHETDLDGKPLSPDAYKGKVVLIDFWATWCGPCVHELPNVQKVYQQYHDKGFEIIGVSLDSEKDKLTGFLKEKQIPWAQYFDGKAWQNKLAGVYGINSIPATYLLGKDGTIIGKGLRGDALDSAVSTALAAK